MIELKYYQYYRTSKEIRTVRRDLVKHALKHGIKPAARRYSTTPKTVRKWVRRYQELKWPGLKDQSKKPHTSPNRMLPYWQFKIQEVCERAAAKRKRLTAKKIQELHKIPYSTKTILKTMQEVGYSRNRKRKYERKRDLRELKKSLKPFEKIQIDVKYLDDIEEMYAEYVVHRLPRYQYTARCVRTGALYYCYAQEKTVTNATIFLLLLLEHLERYGVTLEQSHIQTDNGTEFTSAWNTLTETQFTQAIKVYGKAEHRLIPPGAKTWQSDVESSHRLIEDELYACTEFEARWHFFKEARRYQEYFNLERFNCYKQGSPVTILRTLMPHIDVAVLKFKPVLLDAHLRNVKDKFNALVA